MSSPASPPSCHCTIAVVVALSSERAPSEERRKRNSAGWDLRAVASSAATVAVLSVAIRSRYRNVPLPFSGLTSPALPLPLAFSPLPSFAPPFRSFQLALFIPPSSFAKPFVSSPPSDSRLELYRLFRIRVFYRYQSPRIQDPSRYYSSTTTLRASSLHTPGLSVMLIV